MNIVEYGKEHPEVILFLHGGGLSWWNFRAEAELLQNRYHVVLPILDGHNGSDAPFTTIRQNAADVLAYICRELGGKVHAICGVSLGAQILVELLSQSPRVCDYAVIESALVCPMPLTHALTEWAINWSYPLVSKRWFAQLQSRSLGIPDALFEDYYRDSSGITKSDMTVFLKANASYSLPKLENTGANTLILVGGKERRILQQSADLLHRAIPGSRLETLDGYAHGELCLNHPEKYVTILEHWFREVSP